MQGGQRREGRRMGLCDAVSLFDVLILHSRPKDHSYHCSQPWVRQANTEAQAYLKNYYLNKLLIKRFWLKMIKLEVNIFSSLGILSGNSAGLSPGRSVTFSRERCTRIYCPNYVSCMLND